MYYWLSFHILCILLEGQSQCTWISFTCSTELKSSSPFSWIYLNLHIFTHINTYLHIFTKAFPYLQIFTNVYQYFSIFTSIYRYLPILTNIYQYIPILSHIYLYLIQITHIYPYPPCTDIYQYPMSRNPLIIDILIQLVILFLSCSYQLK